MKGSEKQIIWAQDKIAGLVRANDRLLADEEARYADDVAEEGEGNTARLECRRTLHTMIANFLAEVSETGDAGKIIDYGVDVRQMIVNNQSELAEHKAWISKFSSRKDFLAWAI